MSDLSERSREAVVLGVDLGTSAVKCVVVAQGHILGAAASALSVSSPRPGWSEQEPRIWVDAARDAIRSALSASDVRGDRIIGIGLSGQMHGLVTLDAQNAPLRPAILWNDNRSVAQCAALAAAMPEIGEIAGIGPLPGFTAPKLMWMQDNEPDHYARIRTVLLPKDYLAFRWTGVLGTDLSDAAGTMWLDQQTGIWGARSMAASGVDPGWLPELRHGCDVVGTLHAEAAAELGLPVGVQVFAGGGDAAVGALALGAAEPGRCMLSLGTSGQLLVVDGAYKPDPERYVHAYRHTIPDTWFRMAAMLNGARPLAWFANMLDTDVSGVLRRSEAADPARIPLFLPYLTGERSPHGDPAIRGAFYGLDDATGSAEMARAVVEAIAFSMADALESFGPDTRMQTPVPVIGGGSQSGHVLQCLADALNHPVARAASGQGGAALGAALLAEVGSGQRTLADLCFEPALAKTHTPRPEQGLLCRLDRYRELYAALKPFAASPHT